MLSQKTPRQNPYSADNPAWEIPETGYTHFTLGKTEVPEIYQKYATLETEWLSG